MESEALSSAFIHVSKETDWLYAPKADARIYLCSKESDTFNTYSLREGILHLFSTDGKRLTVKEFPLGNESIDKPEFSIRIYRFGDELGVQLVAPMLHFAGKIDEVAWDKDYPLTGIDDRPRGEFHQVSLSKVLGLEELDHDSTKKQEIPTKEITLENPHLQNDDELITSVRRYDGETFLDTKEPETKLMIEIETSDGKTFCIPSLGEGVLHLLSTTGHQLSITEVSDNDNSIYKIIVQRDGNKLTSKIIAPMLDNSNPEVNNKIKWLDPSTDQPIQVQLTKPNEKNVLSSNEDILEIKLQPFNQI